jgi:hypothetical protein
MSEDNQMYIAEYVKDGVIFGVVLIAILYIWSQHSPVFHGSSLYQHMNVLTVVSFCFAAFSMFVDLLTGFWLAKYEASTNRAFVFIINVVLIFIIYLVGAKYFGFNNVVCFY